MPNGDFPRLKINKKAVLSTAFLMEGLGYMAVFGY